MANWFVKPATVRVDLSDGRWIEIKERLSYGEAQKLASAGLERFNINRLGSDPSIGFDMAEHSTKRMLMWLVDWNAVDEAGKHVEITYDAIVALDPDTAAEIDAAITAHIEKREAEKNATTPGAQ